MKLWGFELCYLQKIKYTKRNKKTNKFIDCILYKFVLHNRFFEYKTSELPMY